MTPQFRAYWETLEAGQRRILVGALVLTMAALVAVGVWTNAERYESVYTGRNPAEVTAVAQALDEQSIPYKISGDGLQVMTLVEHEGQARIASAAAGVVPGFETLDTIELGTSPQRERWAYQRALQGEIMRTINGLEEVESSRVHLVMPERSAFLRTEHAASASVTMKLKAGAALNGAQLRGIAALVAGAVDGLRPGDVVITDSEGRLLAGGQAEDGPTAGLSALTGVQTAMESRVRQNVLAALARVVGSTQDVSVGVTVDLNMVSSDKTTRSQDPDTQVLISETIREEQSANSLPGGIPGTASNLPEEAETKTRESEQSSVEQRSNYSYSQVDQREVEMAGSLKRVSVAVVVNSDRVLALAQALAGEGAADVDTTALESKIEATVRAAMGYNQTRDDEVVVTFLPFSATDDLEAELISAEQDSLVQYAPYAVALIALLLFFFMVVRPIMKAVSATPRPALPGPGGLPELPEDIDVRKLTPEQRARLTDEEIARLEEGRTLAERLRLLVDNFEAVSAEDFNRLVELQEDSSAQVLRRWIRAS